MRVRATIYLRNDHMLVARAELGLTQRELSDVANVPLNDVQRFEKFDYRVRKIKDKARRLALELGLDIDQVLDESRIGEVVESKFLSAKDVSLEALPATTQRLILPAPDDVAEQKDEIGFLSELVKRLNPQQRQVLEFRFGLNGNCQLTQGEIAKRIYLTRSRVGMIENDALRNLRAIYERKDPGQLLGDKTALKIKGDAWSLVSPRKVNYYDKNAAIRARQGKDRLTKYLRSIGALAEEPQKETD